MSDANGNAVTGPEKRADELAWAWMFEKIPDNSTAFPTFLREGRRRVASVQAEAVAENSDAQRHLRDLAFEGALLIEWVRQVVGGLSDPTRAELDDLFDQCSDYSDKWNSGSTEPLPDPRMPSVGRLMDTLHAHRGGSIYATADGMQYTCACGLTGSEVILQHHVAQAVLAIMPKPTDTEETNR